MEGEVLNTIKNISLESLCIAVCVFALTMLIKWPIKKFTKKLSEEKRKAANTVILFIPILLSLLGAVLYYGIFASQWFTVRTFETALSSYVVALTLYAVFERVVILIKGIRSGDIKIDSDLTKETLSFLKSDIKTLTSRIKLDENQVKKIKEKLSVLLELKNVIESDESKKDIYKLAGTNIQIQELKNAEQKLQAQIDENQKQKNSYAEKLKNKKGEDYAI